VFGLLWLWRRHVLTVLAFAMRQFRNTIKQAHKDQRRGVIWHEILHGQWWHPGSVFNYIRLFIHADSVYVGTNMGLFALDARTGRMKWYTLPTCEL
jgi:outer membrane protein assembly factor BamB